MTRKQLAARREINLAGLSRFVRGHIELAQRKLEADAIAHLLAWGDYLNAQLSKLEAKGECPGHLVGLNAFDIANARDTLSTAITQIEDGSLPCG